MTPNLGLGAAQAIEDALGLAGCLTRHDDPEPALREYEAQRYPRTKTIAKQAWLIGATGRWKGAAACAARDWVRLAVPTVAWRQRKKDVGYEVPTVTRS
jgi:2-polyprenyl-6-methoxyphenol hydroxylase-like FAD-dependent oxidoreductase